MSKQEPIFLTIKQASQRLGFSRARIMRHIADGRLPAFQDTKGAWGTWFIPAEAVEKFAADLLAQAEREHARAANYLSKMQA